MVHVSAWVSHQYMLNLLSIVWILLTTIVFLPFVIVIYIFTFVLFILNIRFNLKREKDAQIVENKSSENLDGSMMEYFNNFSTVLYLNLFEKKSKQIFEKTADFFSAFQKRAFYSIMYKRYGNHQVNAIAMIILFLYLIYNIVHWNILVWTATTILLFTQRLVAMFGELTDISTAFTIYVADFERFHTLTQEMEKEPQKSNHSVWKFQSLKIKNLWVTSENKVLLENINLEIKKWEKIAVIWFSGSGKSTLLDVVLKVIKNYSWEIYLNDYDYKTLTVNDIMWVFGIVPQEVQLFKESIKSNIWNVSDTDLYNLIKVVDLQAYIAKQENTYETLIYEWSTNISWWERQRIGIARALSQKPWIIILDEATASLDPKTEKIVIENLVKTYPDMSLIFVTHKYSLLEKFDKIIVFNWGNIIDCDSFSNLMKKWWIFKELYEIWLNKK